MSALEGAVTGLINNTNNNLLGNVEGLINFDGGGGSGTTDYNELTNKPTINGISLQGNKTTPQLHIDYNDLENKPTIPNIEANPIGEIDESLSSIEIDGVIYDIPQSQSGGAVEDVYENGQSVVDENHIAQIKTHKELTQNEYNSLSQSQKNNGILYLVNGLTGTTEQLENITIGKYIENPSVCDDEVNQSRDGVTSYFYGGGQIGNDFWFTEKIDVTNFTSIKYDLSLGTCYSINDSWNYTIGLMSTIPQSWYYANNTSDYVVKKTYTTINTDYTDEELDVSGLSGEYYIAFVAHGWNATINNIRLVSINQRPNRIYYKDTEFANTGGGNSLGFLKRKSNITFDANDISCNYNLLTISKNITDDSFFTATGNTLQVGNDYYREYYFDITYIPNGAISNQYTFNTIELNTVLDGYWYEKSTFKLITNFDNNDWHNNTAEQLNITEFGPVIKFKLSDELYYVDTPIPQNAFIRIIGYAYKLQ